jgi:diguanylate cyclase
MRRNVIQSSKGFLEQGRYHRYQIFPWSRSGMNYKDDGPRSAEILRLALPNISKHGGCYVPTTYAVWYEHFAGTNAPLTDELNRRMERSESLDPGVMSDLYTEHILSRDIRGTRLLQKSLESLARQLEQAAASSSGSTEQYANILEASQTELQSLPDADGLQAVLEKLIASTRDARESVGELRAELDARQNELRAVRDRLGTLESEVVKDPLTGLLNRRGFDRALEQLHADGLQLTSASLLMLDIDHFKRVNDTYGHLFGDQVLCAIGKVLDSLIKGRDIAARFGGEEFVVVLPETPESGAVILAEKFRESFSRARVRRGGSDKVIDKLTISIGVAVPRLGEALETTMERADAALYRAKNDGRNCVRVASSN